MRKFSSLLVASTLAASLFAGATISEAAFQLDEKVSFEYSNKLWAIEGHGFDKAHKYGYTGKGVKVAVIDSGFIDNPSFGNVKKNFEDNASFISDYAKLKGETRNAAMYHGSTVLSTIKAALPDAEYNFYATEKMGGNVKQLMQQAINDNVNIITMSLSQKFAPEEKRAVEQHFNNEFASIIAQAKQKNIAIVVSSGNDKTEKVNYFTLNEYIVSVGAVDNTLNLSSFSSYNDKGEVDFVGAGERLNAADPVTNEKLYIQGTSYAAPNVAAMFGILKQMYPNATVNELKEIMKTISYDLGETGLDEKYGNGFPTFDNFNFAENRVYTVAEKAEEKENVRLEQMKVAVAENKLNLFKSYSDSNEVKFKAANNSHTVKLGRDYEAYQNSIINVKDLQNDLYIETDVQFDDKTQSIRITFKKPLQANNSYAITFFAPYANGHLTILDVVN